MKKFFIPVVLTGLLAAGSAKAEAIVFTNSPGYPFGQYSLILESGTALWFNKIDHCNYGLVLCGHYPVLGDYSTLTPTTWTVDTEMDVYLVPYGSEFTIENIGSGQFSPLFTTDWPYSLDVPFGSFYLGIAAGGNFDQYGKVVGRGVYGWVELNNSASNGLTFVSSGNNAYVGLPVPESDTYTMMLAGLGLIGVAVWFSKKMRSDSIFRNPNKWGQTP